MRASTADDAYLALQHAATQLGAHEYRVNMAAHLARRRRRSTYRHHPSSAHRALVDAMLDVHTGALTVPDAYALLHYGETGYALEMARKDVR